MGFYERIVNRWETAHTLLCVGLDPRGITDPDKLFSWACRIIDATKAYTACYKPNSAFYEALGWEGMQVLEKIIAYIPHDIPVILDVKRADIGPTAQAYADACFSVLKADAVTVNPYMGRDAVDPFLSQPDKAVFVLARTSNPHAKEIQDQNVRGEPLYSFIAKQAVSWSPQVGLVVAGNDAQALQLLRNQLPDTWFLAPGIGAQGGDIAQAIHAGARSDGLGIIPVVARGITEAEDPQEAARSYAEAIQKAVETVRASQPQSVQALSGFKHKLMEGLIATQCFKKGSFVLKSGKVSPFYIDLRRVISDPRVLDLVSSAYCSVIKDLSFDRIAGIPAAALPLATAVSLKSGKPMIWPRIPLKDHGTGQRIEGEFKPGEHILLLDDLITTGASKLEALEVLRAEGLVVTDLVVLIERGKQGRIDMERAGVTLHACFHVRELFTLCWELGIITQEEFAAIEQFATQE
ncbi:MAG TPA: orotidine-5'-phosphate decarboxylase [Spirochaetales bacterium]|nr:orotidine-5'-phosphate decarboxylase [Spirochaetales bacterium]